MKIKALLIAFIITVLTGCKINQHCDAYSHQCDELYNDYNCAIHQRTLSTPPSPTRYAPVPWDYGSNAYYYPNTQSVYYVPVYIDHGDVGGSSPTTNRPRPSIGSYSGNNSGGNVIDNAGPNIHRKPASDARSSRKKRD